MPPTPDERHQWLESLFKLPPRERWGIYLTTGMEAAGLSNSELVDRACAITPKIFQRSNVTHWRNGVSTAEAGRVVIIAQVLHLDGIEALLIAGHDDVADFAAKARADARTALIEQQLALIDDDDFLDYLDAQHARGIIHEDEYAQHREAHLANKRRDIETVIPEAYDAESARIRSERGEPNGSPRRTAL